MIFNLFDGGGGRITEDSFSFTGRHLFASDDDGNWELALLDSGTLTWNMLPGDVDLCLIGAGLDGGAGFSSGGYINSGAGGDSGRVETFSGVRIPASCSVTVGVHGQAESNTILDEFTSATGTVNKGGTGAKMPQNIESTGTVNKGGKDGVWPYDAARDETMIEALRGHKIGASGAAGDANNNKYVYTDQHGGDTDGGDTDGGDGGTRGHRAGYDAAGFGNGGGGGYGDGSGSSSGAGGRGSNGMALIRNHRGG